MGSMSPRSTKSSTSMVRVLSGATPSSSSGATITHFPFSTSYPLTIFSKGTSRPDPSATRLYRIRWPVPSWNWLNRTSCCSVAGYSRTGMLTRPKLIAPLQIGRAIARLLSPPDTYPSEGGGDQPISAPERPHVVDVLHAGQREHAHRRAGGQVDLLDAGRERDVQEAAVRADAEPGHRVGRGPRARHVERCRRERDHTRGGRDEEGLPIRRDGHSGRRASRRAEVDSLRARDPEGVRVERRHDSPVEVGDVEGRAVARGRHGLVRTPAAGSSRGCRGSTRRATEAG